MDLVGVCVSPESGQECAVISKDVGNFLKCSIVVRVLVFKETNDVSLAPLLTPPHTKKVCIIKWYSFLKGETCTLTETSTYIHRINLPHWGQLFHWVDLLLADEVSDGRHWPLTPVLPLHHHPIAEQLQCWILGDAVALSYVRCAQAEGERKLSKERNQLMKSEKKSKNTWGWVDGERRGDSS